MAGEVNRSLWDTALIAEKEARVSGDAAASLVAAYVRRFVPAGVTVIMPGRWGLVVPLSFEVDEGGILELQADAVMEVLR